MMCFRSETNLEEKIKDIDHIAGRVTSLEQALDHLVQFYRDQNQRYGQIDQVHILEELEIYRHYFSYLSDDLTETVQSLHESYDKEKSRPGQGRDSDKE